MKKSHKNVDFSAYRWHYIRTRETERKESKKNDQEEEEKNVYLMVDFPLFSRSYENTFFFIIQCDIKKNCKHLSE
jgi:hypothetical protein